MPAPAAFRERCSVTTKRATAALTLSLLAGCSPAGNTTTVTPQAVQRRAAASPIKHVVFIVQENRSFNNLFLGFPHAYTQNYGYDTNGNKITLQAADLATEYDIDHSSTAYFTACDGTGSLPGTDCKMDGWNNEIVTLHAPKNAPYGYVPRTEIKPYWQMAREYVLSDNTFASNLDGSFVSHQYAVAAFAAHTVDGPAGPWGCEGGKNDTVMRLTKGRTYGSRIVTCFDFDTLAGAADRAGLSWRYYAGGIYDDGGLWSAYQADRKIFHGPDWKADVISPPAQFLTDIGNGALANVTWITPNYATSDHAGLRASDGPAWVASLVNAVGKSPYWKSTAIFIMWDDWGGWFDPAPPIYADYDGLGFRVPLLIVSPYAKQSYVTHVQYETSSVVRYIEDNFGLPQMAPGDTRANDPAADAFDYTQKPRPFKKITGGKPAGQWFRSASARHEQGRSKTVLGDD
jgi:phospholipase C